ncbi:MAG: 50S ribosomal protein L30 [Crocinitomicaceae bacterium]|nr:50S ribosomal protein L30 [Crocinitomicaceae bacterium]MBK6953609.1 50S ribosomal protein L30 [Crocinitomicaceae bacterium]MBK9592670.1 50S ribosomal protein L30 [Crocinitomicaceae bacterium]
MLLQYHVIAISQWIKYLTVNQNKMATIKIKQTKSVINKPLDQKRTIKALGFRKLNQVLEKEATPQILGMIRKVSHLVEEVK